MAAEIGFLKIEVRQLEVGIDKDLTEAGKMLEAAAYTPARQTLVEEPRKGRDPFRVGRKTAALLCHQGMRTVEVDNRGEIQVDAEAAACGPGCFTEGAHRPAARRRGLRCARKLAPDGAQPIDHAPFEINCDKRSRIEFNELRYEFADLAGGLDVALEEDHSGGLDSLENLKLVRAQVGPWNAHHQGHALNHRSRFSV